MHKNAASTTAHLLFSDNINRLLCHNGTSDVIAVKAAVIITKTSRGYILIQNSFFQGFMPFNRFRLYFIGLITWPNKWFVLTL